MDEKEFKKLAANQRDWLIYSLLKPASKEKVVKELEKQSVEESIEGEVLIVTDKAIKIEVGDRTAWIPKKCIKNLDKIVVEQDNTVKIVLIDWFKSKVEWQ